MIKHDYQKHVVETAAERGEFVTLEDGYLYYWPNKENLGALDSSTLRLLADELDTRNKPWDDKINEYFSKN